MRDETAKPALERVESKEGALGPEAVVERSSDSDGEEKKEPSAEGLCAARDISRPARMPQASEIAKKKNRLGVIDLSSGEGSRRQGVEEFRFTVEPEDLKEPGTRAYFFVVLVRSGGGEESPPSNIAALVPQTPPSSASLSRLQVSGEGVEITFGIEDTKDSHPAAACPAGFNIYRRTGDGQFHKPLNATPLTQTSFMDRSADFGRTYHYAVATTLTFSKPYYESVLSDPVEITPLDSFAPPCPSGLSAIPLPGGVELFWKKVEAEDLAGYHVYRSSRGEERQRLTESPVTDEQYTDKTAQPGVQYTYEVTSVDKKAPPNESSPCRPVTATAIAM